MKFNASKALIDEFKERLASDGEVTLSKYEINDLYYALREEEGDENATN